MFLSVDLSTIFSFLYARGDQSYLMDTRQPPPSLCNEANRMLYYLIVLVSNYIIDN